MLALAWWCAHKLTWDCTLIDETEDSSGQGLMQLTGLEKGPVEAGEPSQADSAEDDPSDDFGGMTFRPTRLTASWEEEEKKKKKRKPHAPGVWIVYFSLAALPLFGVGQRFIRPTDLESRRYAFRLLCVYVASGLGLLLTTSFLGLRRYLRQRRVEMPTTMAGAWIAIGGVLIVAILLFAALLPRPAAEYAISKVPFSLGSPERKSNRYALGNDGADENSPDSRSKTEGEPPKSEKKPSGTGGKEPGESGQPSDKGEGKSGSKEGKSEQSSDSKQGQSEGKSEQSSDSKEDESNERSDKSDSEQDRSSQQEDAGKKPSAPSDPQSSFSPSKLLAGLGQWLGVLLKWIFYAAVILVAVFLMWRHWQEILATLARWREELRELWARLFGGKPKPAEAAAAEEAAALKPAWRPFADFTDPFAAGLTARYSADELVEQTFAAFEAWAREHGCPRDPEQTPHEFARRVGAHAESLAADARTLAELYCQVAYARGSLPKSRVKPLAGLWQQLRAGAAGVGTH
jgi:hypothetical protein